MQILLSQNDIETAVRNYVSAMGISRPVNEIQFSVSRKGGQSIEAEIDLADCTGASRPQPEAVPEKTEAPAKKADTETADKAPAAEEPEPATTEPPFTPDAKDAESANDSEEEEPTTESKSLFG